MRSVLGELLAYGDRAAGDAVVDMEAGLEHLSRGTTRSVDALLAIAEPYYRSLETARRMADLARELPVQRVAAIANKVRSAEDDDAITEFCQGHGLPIDARLPWSDGVLDADRAGVPVIDHRPRDPYVSAIEQLVRRRLATPARPAPTKPAPRAAP